MRVTGASASLIYDSPPSSRIAPFARPSLPVTAECAGLAKIIGSSIGREGVNNLKKTLMWLLFLLLAVVAAENHEPRGPSEPYIASFDGSDRENECQSRLERRIFGFSGILFSHDTYGSTPYNRSLNCFLTIAVPKDYRIRIRVEQLDVLVNGRDYGPSGGQCNKDSLHILDHEREVDQMEVHSDSRPVHPPAPGPLIAQLCGKIKNQSDYVVSSLNALSFWWHTDANLRENHDGRGFVLHWSAFRVPSPKVRSCDSKEFRCGNSECIPIELVCNNYPDCKDSSDMEIDNKKASRCLYIEEESISGVMALLLSASVCAGVLCLCVGTCLCVHCIRKQTRKPESKTSNSLVASTPQPTNSSQADSERYVRGAPVPPAFYPPSPPKLPPPEYTPKREAPLTRAAFPVRPGKTVLFSDDRPHEVRATPSEYIYLQNDHRHKLL